MRSKKHSVSASGERHLHHMVDVEAPLQNNTKNNSNSDSGDHLANNSETNSTRKTATRPCWTIRVLVLMTIGLILAAILFAILSYTRLLHDESDTLINRHSSPFQQNNNKLFATKTPYTTAYNYLKKPAQQTLTSSYNPTVTIQPISSSQQDGSSPAPQETLDTSSVFIPDSFSKKNSLESLNQQLIREGCSARQLHFFGRHAARFPNVKEIDRINEHTANVQKRINLVVDKLRQLERKSNSDSTDAPLDGQQQHQKLSPNNSGQPNINNTRSTPNLPAFDAFKLWQPFASSASQANLLTDLGQIESQDIAQRFKQMFPELFNANKTYIKFGVTNELRTTQTALEFAKIVEPRRSDLGCDLDQFPKLSAHDPQSAAALVNDKCLRAFGENFKNNNLAFHKICDNHHGSENKTLDLGVDDNKASKAIADALSKRLALHLLVKSDDQSVGSQPSMSPRLTTAETKALYDACRYESVMQPQTNPSIWCNLFEVDHFKFYEYLQDIKDFYEESSQARSACTILEPLRRKLYTENRLHPKTRVPQEAHFQFTHSSVIQRMLAALLDLKKDPAYERDMVKQSLEGGQAPKVRQWKTSLMSPFSANLAFIVYECPSEELAIEPLATEPPTMDVQLKSPLKVVASLNEQPIRIPKCNDLACDIEYLSEQVRFFQDRTCDPEVFCKTKTVVS